MGDPGVPGIRAATMSASGGVRIGVREPLDRGPIEARTGLAQGQDPYRDSAVNRPRPH